MSGAELSRASGISRRHIVDIESGAKVPSAAALHDIAEALSARVADLYDADWSAARKAKVRERLERHPEPVAVAVLPADSGDSQTTLVRELLEGRRAADGGEECGHAVAHRSGGGEEGRGPQGGPNWGSAPAPADADAHGGHAFLT